MDVFLFAARVETEAKALDYAFELGLVRKDAPTCPLCHNIMKWERGIKRRGVDGIWRCRNASHRRSSSSLFDGSIFQQFYVTVSSFLKTLYCIAQGFTIDETTTNTKLSRATVVKTHKKVREMMMQYNQIHKKRIGGAGMIVEIDECHLHSRKYDVGRIEASELWWVFGGICRQTREMFVVIVENRNQNTLSKAVFENIQSDSIIYSDCWRGYRKLSQMGLGFDRKTVNHSQNFVNPLDRDVYTNTVERAWRSLREDIPKQVGLDAVESYIARFMFFMNAHAKDTQSKFNAMVDLCRVFFPVN